jgi:hypothetical protein
MHTLINYIMAHYLAQLQKAWLNKGAYEYHRLICFTLYDPITLFDYVTGRSIIAQLVL